LSGFRAHALLLAATTRAEMAVLKAEACPAPSRVTPRAPMRKQTVGEHGGSASRIAPVPLCPGPLDDRFRPPHLPASRNAFPGVVRPPTQSTRPRWPDATRVPSPLPASKTRVHGGGFHLGIGPTLTKSHEGRGQRVARREGTCWTHHARHCAVGRRYEPVNRRCPRARLSGVDTAPAPSPPLTRRRKGGQRLFCFPRGLLFCAEPCCVRPLTQLPRRSLTRGCELAPLLTRAGHGTRFRAEC